MQVAHPQVARGVVEHSAYPSDRLGRLQRTLRPMYTIAFGTPDEARAAEAGVRAVHQRVVGAGYRADDPPLLGWVLATLIDTALLMYRRFIAPIAPHGAEAYYAGMLSIDSLLGTPRSALPESFREFESYVAELVATIELSDDSRRIAHELFAPVPGAPWLRPAMPLARELTVGLLPARLREQYGMSWGPGREAVLAGAARLSRTVRPALPSRLTAPPANVMPASYRQRRRGGF